MATSESLFLAKVSGQIGRQLVVKQYQGKTVISKFPEFKKNRKFSKKQAQVQKIMYSANYKAKAILLDPKLSMEAQARLNVTRNKLYTALIREYFAEQKSK